MSSTEILVMTIGGAGLAIGLAGIGASIGQRMAASASSMLMAERPERFGLSLILTVLVETSAIYGLLVSIIVLVGLGGVNSSDQALGALSAGLCVGVAGFCTGVGEGVAASASVGAVADREAIFGKSLVLTVLPETGAIYGLLIAVLVLRASGFLGTPPAQEEGAGIASLYAALVVAATSVASYLQGRVGASAISSASKREEVFGRNLIFVVLLESVAIYGLLISILILSYTGLL
ncbi:MAG: V-type ATP synthase subunit K [Nitrososphaeria archaeon]|nr:V-type ATP synthase subunit K [Candidatus Bathyarchaeota archaeon]